MLTEPLREKTNRQTRSNTNQAVQLQKQGRGLELWISVEEELYYPSSENRGADQLSSNCAFCLAYEIVSFLMSGSILHLAHFTNGLRHSKKQKDFGPLNQS